jgi:putative ABC transport system substrate-binding protein
MTPQQTPAALARIVTRLEYPLTDTCQFVAGRRAEALIVDSDPFFLTRREQFAVLAARYAIPVIYQFREFVAAGGLMSALRSSQRMRWRSVGTGRWR